jgi:serine/threonine protein kinase
MQQVIANRYQIIEAVGAGGMGTVYKGRDTTTQQLVAIKHLKPDLTSPELIERFKREGDALRELNHPNIVKVLDTVEADKQHYLIIEYLAGGDLAELLKKEPLSVKQTVKLALEIADALTRAHHLNIIHRDLKPANVLIADDGTPRLSDFGIAHIAKKQRVTASDVLIGTVDYLAPETIEGRAIDNRTDIWAFGVMLFEMLTGKRPFQGESVAQTLMGILTEPVPDLESLRPDIPLGLADLIYRMLEKDPQQRIPSVRVVGAELEALLQENRTTPVTPVHHFQPQRTAATTPVHHNLPMQLTTFIGRKNELAELAQLLQKDDVRLVTIAAQGGMGKSRLALESARQQLNIFAEGVYLIELAPLSEVGSIVQALIDAVRCPYAPDEKRSRTQQLIEFLADKQMLLVLDNFEHLMAGAGIVTEILIATAQVRIIVTSRQRLSQSNEHIIQLEAMPYPDWETPADAMKYDAFQLFLQSARRIRPDFELTADNLDYVTRICQGVQGLPLGIVLAASWLSLLSPQEIVSEMHKSFDFLETEMTDVPARQRSMRQVFEYSWQLMTEKEQQILMALSVFRGGFTREAAAAVCQAGLRDLMGLMNKSLINRDAVSGRYSIHELLRQYAAEHLQQSGQQDTTFDAHKLYFAAWMLAREGEITYRRQQAALDDIEVDFENVRFAWERAVEQHDYASLNQMVEALHLFTEMRIRHDEGYKMLHAAFNITPKTEHLYHRLIFRKNLLAQRGGFSHYESTMNELQLAKAQATTHNDIAELGFGLYIEGSLHMDGDVSKELFAHAQNLLGSTSFYYNRIIVSQAISFVGIDYDRRRKLFQEAIMLERERGDVNELAWTLANFISMFVDFLKFNEMEQHIDEALHYSRLIRHPHAESMILNNVGYMTFVMGDFEKTLEIAARSYYLAKQANQLHGMLNARLLKLHIKHLLHEPVSEVRSEITSLISKGKEAFPWLIALLDNSLLHSFNGDDTAARRAWQTTSFPITPQTWILLFAVEVVVHTQFGAYEFAATLIGHLSNYGDDVLGWLKRWSRYQDALAQLQARLDEVTYQAAFAHGQSLTLDEMVQELKANTGAA